MRGGAGVREAVRRGGVGDALRVLRVEAGGGGVVGEAQHLRRGVPVRGVAVGEHVVRDVHLDQRQRGPGLVFVRRPGVEAGGVCSTVICVRGGAGTVPEGSRAGWGAARAVPGTTSTPTAATTGAVSSTGRCARWAGRRRVVRVSEWRPIGDPFCARAGGRRCTGVPGGRVPGRPGVVVPGRADGGPRGPGDHGEPGDPGTDGHTGNNSQGNARGARVAHEVRRAARMSPQMRVFQIHLMLSDESRV